MSSPWWAAFPPADASVSCAGKHRLRWQDGKLTAVDHPDQESELVLAALGGDQPECVRLVGAWGTHSADLDVLTLGPRTPADKIAVPTVTAGWHTGPMMHGFSRSTSHGFSRPMSWAGFSAEDASRSDLLDLLKLGSDLTFRLMATVAANATDTSARPRLTAALSGRLAPAIHTWLGIDPDQVDARIPDTSRRRPGFSARTPRSTMTWPSRLSFPAARSFLRTWAGGLACWPRTTSRPGGTSPALGPGIWTVAAGPTAAAGRGRAIGRDCLGGRPG